MDKNPWIKPSYCRYLADQNKHCFISKNDMCENYDDKIKMCKLSSTYGNVNISNYQS